MPDEDTAPAETTTEATADAPADGVNVHDVGLPEPGSAFPAGPGGQLDILLDTPMSVSAILGEAGLEVREILQLGPGSVIKLDRRAGDPVDLFLRGVKFGSGRLVVVGETLGVRIEEILPPPSE